MKQYETIRKISKALPKVPGLQAGILYGSFARSEPTPNSDIDIKLLVDENFDPEGLCEVMTSAFNSTIEFCQNVHLRNKVVLYFNNQPKVEFAICKDLKEIERDYLGSEIKNIDSTILYQSSELTFDLNEYLTRLVQDQNLGFKTENIDNRIKHFSEKFIYEFENCSDAHRRSDAYRFYFFFNLALHVVVQIRNITTGSGRFGFLPKNLLVSAIYESELMSFYNCRGTLFLPDANQHKRNLFEFFLASIKPHVTTALYDQTKIKCNWLYDRDYHWNIRDISKHNPKIKSGLIFRSSALSLIRDKDKYQQLVNDYKIDTIIDLRAEKEVTKHPYQSSQIKNLRYVHAPFDPWNQPEWFKKKHNKGTNVEIAYRFFALGCNQSIKVVFDAILANPTNPHLVHCFAGKDRTGFIITLFHLLVEADFEVVKNDYLASEYDTALENLELWLGIIEEKGGIEKYLYSCGIDKKQITNIRTLIAA